MKTRFLYAAAALALTSASPVFAQAYAGGTGTFTGIGSNTGSTFDIADLAPVAGNYTGVGTYDFNTVTFTAGPNNTGTPTLSGVLTGLTGTFAGNPFAYSVGYTINIGNAFDTITLGGNKFNVGSTTVLINPLTLTSGGAASVDTLTVSTGSAVPEPATWAMMMLGFGMVGLGLRRRAKHAVRVTYA